MPNEEKQEQTDSLQEEPVEEVIESEEEVTDEPAEQEEATAPDWEAEAKKWKAIAERSKRKASKEGKRADLKTPDATPAVDVDERILRNEGYDDELMTQLKKVAQFNETDLMTAKTDPMFLSIKEQIEQKRADEAASLGASRGSGAGKPRKDLSTSGLKADEHKKLWRQATKGM